MIYKMRNPIEGLEERFVIAQKIEQEDKEMINIKKKW